MHLLIQCESTPLSIFLTFFPEQLGIFSPNFKHLPRSNLRWNADVCAIICNFDEVMPY